MGASVNAQKTRAKVTCFVCVWLGIDSMVVSHFLGVSELMGRSFSREVESIASRNASFLMLNTQYFSLRQEVFSPSLNHRHQVGNEQHFLGVCSPKVGNESYVPSHKTSEP